MKYMGSKNRHAKEILAIMLKDRKDDQYFVEPFVGGANVLDKVAGNRIGADINEYLIAMWQKVSEDGWLPPETFSEKEYKQIQSDKSAFQNYLVGYVGFALSYSGKWFGGWCRDGAGVRNYVNESFRNALKQFPKLKDVRFICCEYKNLTIPNNSIVYCDPPYKDTTKYKDSSSFNHEEFYQWCRDKAKEGHTVYVSEYWMPDDFECVWQKQVNSSLAKDTGSKKAVEKLFKYKGTK